MAHTTIEGYRFPKGSTAIWRDKVFIVEEGGDLALFAHWEFDIPGYPGKIGTMDTERSVAAKRVHDMLKTKGWVQ